MTQPYENQLIGAFLYALGYLGGRRSAPRAIVNLFQQTPLDKSFSDLVVGASQCVVIEFKRDRESLISEREKWKGINLEQVLRRVRLDQISRQIHYVVHGEPRHDKIQLAFCQYLDVLDPSRTIALKDAGRLMELLYDRLRPGDGAIGAPRHEFERYLDWLMHNRQGKDGRTLHQPAWLAVVNVQGQLVLRVADSLAQLIMELQPEPAPQHEHDWEPPGP